jgi:hypothetical protein
MTVSEKPVNVDVTDDLVMHQQSNLMIEEPFCLSCTDILAD